MLAKLRPQGLGGSAVLELRSKLVDGAVSVVLLVSPTTLTGSPVSIAAGRVAVVLDQTGILVRLLMAVLDVLIVHLMAHLL